MADDEEAGTGSPPGPEVAYDTDGWTNRQRAKLTETLLEAGVSHEWSGTELVVAPHHLSLIHI